MSRKLLISILIIGCCVVAKAQSNYGVQLGADFDKPVGSFAHIYKPTLGYHLDFLWFADENTKTVNFTLGYNNFKPKEDTFYYLTQEGTDYGTLQQSDYKAITAYVGYMRNFALTEVVKFGLGFNFGAYFSQYTTSDINYRFDSSASFKDVDIYFAAKTGFSYDFTEQMQINVQAKYNGFTPTGKNNARMPALNDSRLGTVNYTWAAGLALAYKF